MKTQEGGFTMSIISEVKCARCDRKYSGLRSRCPYCGARRIGRGKYSEETDNAKGKMLISIMIIGVLVIAVLFLLLSVPKPDKDDNSGSLNSPTGTPMLTDDDNSSLPGNNRVSPTPTPTPMPTEIPDPPAPKVQSVMITANNRENNDFTVKVAETVILRVKVEPIDFEDEIIWKSSDESVFEVVPISADKTQAKVTGIGVGNAKVTVTVGDVADDCIVRGKKR
jgi:DNA-directed RNA polymerase subunit RPC12/RpoP